MLVKRHPKLEKAAECAQRVSFLERLEWTLIVLERRRSEYRQIKADIREEAIAEGLEEGRAEGLEQGRAKGLEEGRAEGLEEGRAEGLEEGRAEGLEEGRAKGMEEGLEEGLRQAHEKTLEIAYKMKEAGDSNEKIQAITGIPIETVQLL